MFVVETVVFDVFDEVVAFVEAPAEEVELSTGGAGFAHAMSITIGAMLFIRYPEASFAVPG